jgi:predicted TIM-barrel fold metal-dependent hydrolase
MIFCNRVSATSLVVVIVVGVAAEPRAQTRSRITAPRVDHHQHLMGPAIAALATGQPPLPAIELPVDLVDLLRERARRWNDAASLASLYADNSIVLAEDRRGWLRGPSAVAGYLARRFARAYQLTPVHVHRTAASASIHGYYTRGDDAALQYLGYFIISAERDATERWHIVSEVPRFPFPTVTEVVTGDQLLNKLDEAGIARAVVLSEAFWADGPILSAADPYALVVAENDWTAAQSARHPDRLIAFCSFNPVADHALRELERCASNRTFRGLKFSFAMSGVDLRNSAHVARVRAVFAAANRHRLPIVAHLRGGADYTPEHVAIFLDQIMSAAPDIVVQIAHLWGGEAFSSPVLAALAEACAAGRPGTRNLYFDVAEAWQVESPEVQTEIARRIRQISLRRVLFGSDGRTPPRQAWAAFRTHIPLSDEEFRVIAENAAPYAR